MPSGESKEGLPKHTNAQQAHLTHSRYAHCSAQPLILLEHVKLNKPQPIMYARATDRKEKRQRQARGNAKPQWSLLSSSVKKGVSEELTSALERGGKERK